MEGLLSENGTWEEEMYWKHFHAMHFYQVLPKDFLDHLVFPSKFAEHISSNLPNKVSLIGPSGATWDVEVSKTGSLALCGEGWKDFAKAYHLEENLLMVFKYKQNSSFEVLIFDQKNFCEKESSYFVKKSSPDPDLRLIKRRSVCETASTEVMETNDDGYGGSECLAKKPKKICLDASSEKNHDDTNLDLSDKAIDDVIVKVISSVGMKSCTSNTDVARDAGRPGKATRYRAQSAKKLIVDSVAKKLRQLNEKEQTPTENGGRELIEKVIISAGNSGNSGALSDKAINGDSPPGPNHSRKSGGKKGRSVKRGTPKSAEKSVLKSGTTRLSREYMSNRRPVTSEEKEAAISRANEALTEGSFIVVLRPSAVYKKFYMSIPSEWMNKNLPQRHQEVILRIGEKTWVTMFLWYSQRASSGGLGTGWKNFAIENNLEDSDVCLFKPANLKEDATLILDVEIFRVVQEVTPLSPAILPLASVPYDSQISL